MVGSKMQDAVRPGKLLAGSTGLTECGPLLPDERRLSIVFIPAAEKVRRPMRRPLKFA